MFQMVDCSQLKIGQLIFGRLNDTYVFKGLIIGNYFFKASRSSLVSILTPKNGVKQFIYLFERKHNLFVLNDTT